MGSMAIKRITVLLASALAVCGSQAAGNPAANAAPLPVHAAPVDRCDMPRLDLDSVERLSADDRARFTANFRAAFDRACAEKLFAEGPLIDERSYERSTLYVVAANEANVASIYFAPSGAPPVTMMEVPFRDPPQIPTVEDLHETIYCWMQGATAEEQETTGRCLPD
jgi:hypothetical protein